MRPLYKKLEFKPFMSKDREPQTQLRAFTGGSTKTDQVCERLD